jgi:hypothetical protein
MISTLEIARQEIDLLPRGFYINGEVIAIWLSRHHIARKNAAADMRNSLQRMCGHNPPNQTSPRQQADCRIIPCKVKDKTIPQTVWDRLGGCGPAQNTGYLITGLNEPKQDKQWWRRTMNNDEVERLRAAMAKKDTEIAQLKIELELCAIPSACRAFEKRLDLLRSNLCHLHEMGHAPQSETIPLVVSGLKSLQDAINKTTKDMETAYAKT